jgi:hypothetical protein
LREITSISRETTPITGEIKIISRVTVTKKSVHETNSRIVESLKKEKTMHTRDLKCRSNEGSTADRTRRKTLLKTATAYCLMDVKALAYKQFADCMTLPTQDTFRLAYPSPVTFILNTL